MLVRTDGQTIGTIGGGKFEALVVEACARAMESRTPVLKTYPLHEGSELSFGAICGGEVTVLIEPFPAADGLYLVGAGHCARAVAELARACGWRVTVLDDRADLLSDFPADASVADRSPAEFIAQHPWKAEEALVIVSRNFHIDRDALRSALSRERIAYIGMIGSRKKVRHVFRRLACRTNRGGEAGVSLCPHRFGCRRGFSRGNCGRGHGGSDAGAPASGGWTSAGRRKDAVAPGGVSALASGHDEPRWLRSVRDSGLVSRCLRRAHRPAWENRKCFSPGAGARFSARPGRLDGTASDADHSGSRRN
jgi:hypothetical protein